MSRIQLIIVGAILVGVIGSMTMIASFPKLYSPYSFAVVIPALIASSLNLPTIVFKIVSVLPLVALYLLWSFSFVKPPYRVSLTQQSIFGVLVLLSTVFNIASFGYGLRYQGELHTYLMYIYNIFLLLCLSLILWRNTKKASLNSCMGFGVLLFSWLGWVAFPWLGELI